MQLPEIKEAEHRLSFTADGIQWAFDATSLKVADTCLRKYQYEIVEGWQSPFKKVDLWFGGIYASALEHFHKFIAEGQDRETALREVVLFALIESWDHDLDAEGTRIPGTGAPPKYDHNAKTRENLIRTIIWYVDSFEKELFQTYITAEGKPAVEFSFHLPVNDEVSFVGHIDRLCLDNTGEIFVHDQKTTGQTLGPYYFKQFKPDIQMCQPAGTLILTPQGEVPIETLKVGDSVIVPHNDKPKLRNRKVLGAATREYTGLLFRLTAGNKQHDVTPNHRCVIRLQESVRHYEAVYLMRKGEQYRIGQTSLRTRRDFKNGLSQRCRLEKADAMWLLAACPTREEAWAIEQWFSWKFSIPTFTFLNKSFDNYSETKQDQLDWLWQRIGNNTSAAAVLLSSLDQDMQYPIYEVNENTELSFDRKTLVRACNLQHDIFEVAVLEEEELKWHPLSTTTYQFSGQVFSLEIEKVPATLNQGMYIANDILTGNSMYTFAGKAIYEAPVKGVILDAAQIAVGFSRYGRSPILFTDDELQEWYDETLALIADIQKAARNNYFPKRPASCNNFGGCPFREVCSRPPAVRDAYLRADFQQTRHWDPARPR